MTVRGPKRVAVRPPAGRSLTLTTDLLRPEEAPSAERVRLMERAKPAPAVEPGRPPRGT